MQSKGKVSMVCGVMWGYGQCKNRIKKGKRVKKKVVGV